MTVEGVALEKRRRGEGFVSKSVLGKSSGDADNYGVQERYSSDRH